MNDNELYAIGWKCVAAVLMVGVASIAGCSAHEHYVDAQSVQLAVQNGVDPVRTRCAIAIGSTDHTLTAGDIVLCTGQK